MKLCPECRRNYTDDTLVFCLDDGSRLLDGPGSTDETATAMFGVPPSGDLLTGQEDVRATAIISGTRESEAEPRERAGEPSERHRLSAHRAAKPLAVKKVLAILGVSALLLIAGFFGFRNFAPGNSKQIE